MPNLVRVSISLEQTLLSRLERLVRAGRYTNRSEFIRDLVRQRLVQQEWADQHHEVVATITMIYDHHARQLADKLVNIQHDHHECILAVTHVHLTRDLCAEMIMLRGIPRQVQQIADHLRQQRGVLHAALAMSTTGKKLA